MSLVSGQLMVTQTECQYFPVEVPDVYMHEADFK